ncbi:MAG: efflux RND transporter periplasmic adaptor subunit [Candidatus Parcubacteria bacterium]|nr:efflux RND transporter periplasmic adaptor subunit [Candidatus Parcubacteria bacterium]
MSWIFNTLKRLAKKKSFWIVLIIVVIIVIVILNMIKGKKTVYTMEKVKLGNLVQTVSETGTVESASAIDLNFKGSGKLAELKVKEGDKVKSGQLLSRLDAGSLEIAVRQAQANVDIAQANLNKLLAGASAEDLKVTEETVNNARIAFENAKNNYDNSLLKIDADTTTYEQAVTAAQTSLDNTKNTYTKSVSDARQNLLTTLRNKANVANTSLDFINYQYNNLNNVSDQQAKSNTMWSYNLAMDNKTKLVNFLNKSDQSMSEDEITQAGATAITLFEQINDSLNNLFNCISSTVIDARFSQLLVDNAKALVKAEQTADSANLSALQAADQTYKTAKLSYTSVVDTATSNLTTAQNNLNSVLANKDVSTVTAKAALDSAQGAYNLAKAQFELKKAKPRLVDIGYYQAQVNQAAAARDLALNNLNDYIIFAPTDGVVTFVNYKLGEQIGVASTKSAISMLGTGDFQIKVDVPESDIIKIKVGDPVKITLDAYGSADVFEGKIVSINIAETVIQDVVYYKVTAQIDPTDKEIKSGMTANVDIITATAENVLSLSGRAIKQDETGKKYVEILKFGNNVEKVMIETGIKADTGTEIKSGLQEGQEVIISKTQK